MINLNFNDKKIYLIGLVIIVLIITIILYFYFKNNNHDLQTNNSSQTNNISNIEDVFSFYNKNILYYNQLEDTEKQTFYKLYKIEDMNNFDDSKQILSLSSSIENIEISENKLLITSRNNEDSDFYAPDRSNKQNTCWLFDSTTGSKILLNQKMSIPIITPDEQSIIYLWDYESVNIASINNLDNYNQLISGDELIEGINQLQISYDQKYLAISKSGEISGSTLVEIINIDTKDKSQISGVNEINFAPDSQKLVYVQPNFEGNELKNELWIYNITTKKQSKLLNKNVNLENISWYSDSSQIIVAVGDDSENYKVYKIDVTNKKTSDLSKIKNINNLQKFLPIYQNFLCYLANDTLYKVEL